MKIVYVVAFLLALVVPAFGQLVVEDLGDTAGPAVATSQLALKGAEKGTTSLSGAGATVQLVAWTISCPSHDINWTNLQIDMIWSYLVGESRSWFLLDPETTAHSWGFIAPEDIVSLSRTNTSYMHRGDFAPTGVWAESKGSVLIAWYEVYAGEGQRVRMSDLVFTNSSSDTGNLLKKSATFVTNSYSLIAPGYVNDDFVTDVSSDTPVEWFMIGIAIPNMTANTSQVYTQAIKFGITNLLNVTAIVSLNTTAGVVSTTNSVGMTQSWKSGIWADHNTKEVYIGAIGGVAKSYGIDWIPTFAGDGPFTTTNRVDMGRFGPRKPLTKPSEELVGRLAQVKDPESWP